MRDPLRPLPNAPAVDAMPSVASPVKPLSQYDCNGDMESENRPLTSSIEHQNSTSASPNYHHSPLYETSPTKKIVSPTKRSPLKYRLQDDTIAMNSPPDSPIQRTSDLRFNEGITRAISDMQLEEEDGPRQETVNNTVLNEEMSTIHNGENCESHDSCEGDVTDIDITLNINKTIRDDTVGDLSTISAIPTDLTQFANLRNSPTKPIPADGWTPRPNRNSIAMSTPATRQRPLLLSGGSTSSNEDEEATPRMMRRSTDSPLDLMNFTGQTNILIPPPGSAPRTSRRSPSGRGAFPIRVNPTPAHRSQASIDREKATGRSPQKMFSDQPQVPVTPASSRNSMQSNHSFGMDLLDIDLGPIATPRSIPTITPRELETLRSEMQSKISGLEATLSGKEAEVSALNKAIADAEIRAGKSSEALSIERSEKEELRTQKDELDRRAREMEDVLREVKQNAFVEEREREKLRRQAEDAEKRAEECEVKILELNASLDTLKSERVKQSPSPIKRSEVPSTPGAGSSVDVDAAVKNATETVARELHALYKSKHERKVADLKLSYEKRWIKQVDALKAELKESQEEVSRLLNERDVALPGMVVPGQSEALSKMEGQIEELRRWNEDLSAQKRVCENEIAGLRSEVDSVKRENESLRADLEAERAEKGELVAQVEVFLTVSAEQEREREVEREAREARERERQPVSPPRSDASGEISAGGNGPSVQLQSPNKPRAMNGVFGVSGRPRPMSMLAKPTTGKFGSGIPGPGTSGLKAPTATGVRPGVYGRGSLMDGIARMGAGNR